MLEFQRFIGFNRTTVECKFDITKGDIKAKAEF